jgi:hypothetical protein
VTGSGTYTPVENSSIRVGAEDFHSVRLPTQGLMYRGLQSS